ncbi:MAG: hypothetical protein L3J41_14525 [Melioribacteraceae bacterium]|nr:hypothetical protein [Melioribacteraceae bacterium]
MIKRFLQILILTIFLINIAAVAQNSSNVDVRAIVKAQMLEAQGGSQMITKESVEKNSRIAAFPNISSGVFNILILMLSATIVLSLVFLRRVKIQQKIISKQFKENIRLLREENLRKPIDHSLTPVRMGLLEKIENCFGEQNITALARKLKIAKGEILLVNNIKSYGSETNIARNQA